MLPLFLLGVFGTAEATTQASGALGIRLLDDLEQSVISQAWDDISATGTVLNLTDDATTTVQLPFSFSLPNGLAVYDQVTVSSNGLISPGATGTTAYSNTCLPATAPPDTTLMVMWDDLNPSAGGQVQWEVRGPVGNRALVVQWTNVPYYSTSTPVTFQAVIAESGVIEYRYQDLGGRFGDSATIGLQSGGEAMQYGCNAAGVLIDGRVIRFQTLGPGADADGDGWDEYADCDESDPTIHPTAFDLAGDGLDANCDGTDELVLRVWAGPPGSVVELDVIGLAPGSEAQLLMSTAGPGAGPCPPQLGGDCLELLRPQLLTSAVAGPDGVASHVLAVPMSAQSGMTAWFQAWVLDGTPFSTDIRSATVP
jgi:hypothetical protein